MPPRRAAHRPDVPSIVIAAGGTGGHIYPGLALAAALRRLSPDAEISFVGTPRGLEGTLIPEAGYRLHLVGMVPFAGRERFIAPFALVRAAWQCTRILSREHASVAVGMGGYAGIPLILAARLRGVASLVHESGAISGRANRLATRFTPNVALAFEEARASLAGDDVRVVGMPLSGEVASFDRDALRADARAAFGLDPSTAMLLVVGGSQGSARLDALALGLAQRWRDRDDVLIVLKSARGNLATVEEQSRSAGTTRQLRAVSYLERMDHAYAAADIGIFRAGAATVAELALVGLPSVLVPYPYAPDDHQALNAKVLVDAGAAVMVRDHEAIADRVGPVVEAWLADRSELERVAAAARSVARPRAAEDLASWVLELAGSRTGRRGGDVPSSA